MLGVFVIIGLNRYKTMIVRLFYSVNGVDSIKLIAKEHGVFKVVFERILMYEKKGLCK